MKITVTVSRKIGQPNYGSEGAGCEITLETAEKSASANPAALVDEIRRAYALAETAVSEQLAYHQVEQQQPAAAEAPAAGSNGYSQSKSRTTTGKGNPDAHRQYGLGPHNGRPKNGRELYPWAKRLEESNEFPKLTRKLAEYGKGQEFPDRMVDWSREEVEKALSELVGAADRN